MSNTTFKRNQIEAATWSVMSASTSAAPRIFLTRLKRLLETDRKFRHEKIRGITSAECAFSEHRTEGKGFEAEFSNFDAFCLGLGLDMLDAGYNPQEIVFLIRHIRHDLEREFDESLRNPVTHRQSIDPKERPGCPSIDHKGTKIADCRRFLVLQKIVVTEALHGAAGKGKAKPMFLHPIYCQGLAGLMKELNEAGDRYRKAYVQELAHLACRITTALDETPPIKRGRK